MVKLSARNPVYFVRDGKKFVRLFGIEGALEFPLKENGRPDMNSPDAVIDISKLDPANLTHLVYIRWFTQRQKLHLLSSRSTGENEGDEEFDTPILAKFIRSIQPENRRTHDRQDERRGAFVSKRTDKKDG